ncbi:MAG: GGDEF domain-containing protein, partial [Actinomycetota bacterium]
PLGFDLDERAGEGAPPRALGWYLLVCGAVAHARAEHERAIRVLGDAIPMLDSLGEHHGMDRALLIRRDCWTALGDTEQALVDANRLVQRAHAVRRSHFDGLAVQIEERAKVEVARLALRRRADDLAEAVSTDTLTGVRTRRWFEVARDELAMVRGDATVAMLDLDHFKRINDEHGHQAGDEVLRRVGRILTGSFRSDDLVIRFGGEEFLAVLPRTSLTAGRALVDRIRVDVAESEWDDIAPGLAVRLSAGVASGRLGDLDGAISRADGALYEAKRQGRDRIAVGI